ncbi:MAG: MFS transporter [Bdellovibrio sp. CG10_big_fil_rev_8_21_14_0_10_47_8]|nr:MAG: MFS transporter [Bdellovibrio sp. CG10_big_fil_rev_8_21_14_0_10_47_8]
MGVIFFTVFLYLVGFGVVIPILPILARNLGASSLEVGLLMSVYSLMQFVFAPFWGRLSDRKGRRPILLLCLVGETLSYIAFGFARNLEGLFLARLFAGFFGASISTASAYISDITPQNERSKGMALIGVAFGLGFLFGPVLGGGLAIWGAYISPAPHFDTSFAAFCVAGLCLANFAFAFRFLKESLPEHHRSEGKQGRFTLLFRYVKKDLVGPLIGVFFLSSLAMSMMEASLVLFVGDRFDWGVKEVSFGFAYLGLIIVISQGLIVRRILPIVGEKKVLWSGLLLLAVGMSGIAISDSIPVLAVFLTLLAVGNSFINPSTLGSISLLTDIKEQGVVMGTTQGTASLGRILGPALGGFFYQQFSQGSPFVTGGAFACLGLATVSSLFKRLPESAKGARKSKSEHVALPIGFFQFDNLVRNRIPFVLIRTELDVETMFPATERAYLQTHTSVVSELDWKQVTAHLTERKVNKEDPVLILCQDGKKSQAIADRLSAQYMNVYYVLGGFQSLKDESAAE